MTIDHVSHSLSSQGSGTAKRSAGDVIAAVQSWLHANADEIKQEGVWEQDGQTVNIRWSNSDSDTATVSTDGKNLVLDGNTYSKKSN